jgi:ribosomal protein S18 acetylase RimI-like enzyme
MPEIEVRPAAEPDIAQLVNLDHSYTSDHVWQMELQPEGRSLGALFRAERLPRAVRVEYPRPVQALSQDWQDRPGLLVAMLAGAPVGYASLALDRMAHSAWMTDLVVDPRLRRQGIGSALVLAALEWAAEQRRNRLILEMQPKNYPAVSFVQVLGFDFAGYLESYYPNQDLALLFAKWVA